MKKQGTEFYIGLFIWVLELPISYGLWFAGNEVAIKPALSTANVVLTAAFFLLYLVGYCASHGFFKLQLNARAEVFGLALSSVATLALSIFFFFFMVALMATMIIIQLAPLVKQKWALLIAVLVPVVCVLLDVWLGKGFAFTNIIVYGVFNVLALVISYGLIAERNAKRESEQLVRELTSTRILLSATTKRDERLRIARDLHDVLGHQLTALSLQLEVASHVNNEEKQKHVQQAQAISRVLLSDVRETVAEFRQKKDLALHEALTALVRDIPGLKVELNMDVDQSLTDARQVEVILRCVQEALTNTLKHASASHCKIQLAADEQNLVLSVEDNGSSSVEIDPGNGLTGMAERVAKVDGRLDYHNDANGFALTVKLPKHR